MPYPSLIMTALRLPFSFDPELLQSDLRKVQSEEWIGHYRNDEYEGEWALVPLRAVGGHPLVVHAVPINEQNNSFKNTPILERCTYFKQVLERLQCPVGAARLMLLGAGARILEHSDDMAKEIRLHIPIQTNDQVFFWVDHKRVPMQVGEFWYADFTKTHSVENNSPEARIHLVVDCLMNEWLENMLITSRITHFLNEIGIETAFETLDQDTFLPGMTIQNGVLKIDLAQLKYPGDLLHEAGHIAVTPADERPILGGNIIKDNDTNKAMGEEISAILWSFAALKAIGLKEEVVFHPFGYKDASDWHIDNFTSGNYIGLPLLTWMGMADATFPNMVKWLR
jgi:hypothetical protein